LDGPTLTIAVSLWGFVEGILILAGAVRVDGKGADVIEDVREIMHPASSMPPAPRQRLAAGLLGIFLGGLGAHRYYLGYYATGIVQLTLFSVGWIIGLYPVFVAYIWGFTEGILILKGIFNTDARGRVLMDPVPTRASGALTTTPSPKSRIAAGVFGVLLGGLGVHRYYLGYPSVATIQFLLWISGWIMSCGPYGAIPSCDPDILQTVGAVLLAIASCWGLIEGIMILTGHFRRDAEPQGWDDSRPPGQ
jgi:TM2 domain-containing membrane protein YozV